MKPLYLTGVGIGVPVVDLTAIILTKDEELHIARCIASLKPIAKRIIVVDSGSSDRTVQIATTLGAEMFRQDWLGHARQFNWALDHCVIRTAWVMRLDADEYVDEILMNELQCLEQLPAAAAGVQIRRTAVFMNRMLRFGGNSSVYLLRAWRTGLGRVEVVAMDEHVVLSRGHSVKIKGCIVDHNLKPLSLWIAKHNDYAAREALALLAGAAVASNFEGQHVTTRVRRFLKTQVYRRAPRFVRPWLFFAVRYFFLGGFLDGRAGFIWHFFQCLWYRMLVDAKVFEAELRARQDGVTRPVALLSNNPGLAIYAAERSVALPPSSEKP